MLKKSILPLNSSDFRSPTFPRLDNSLKALLLSNREYRVKVIWHKNHELTVPKIPAMIMMCRIKNSDRRHGFA
jgi:hypothetical protein